MASKSDAPGAGTYEIGSNAFPENGRFHMGIKLKDMGETVKVPGAGSYDPDYKTIHKNLPKFSMKQKLGSTMGGPTGAPGPGQYDSSLKDKR